MFQSREDKRLIDEQGYRFNVGIVVANQKGQLLWARRIRTENAWQFPQGGMQEDESPAEAMFRELLEELGLKPNDVQLLAEAEDWLMYKLPEQYIRHNSQPLCIGQKQKWFLLRLVSDDTHIRLDHSKKPEFDCWKWVDYWYPIQHVIDFKYGVYKSMLTEFESLIQSTRD